METYHTFKMDQKKIEQIKYFFFKEKEIKKRWKLIVRAIGD